MTIANRWTDRQIAFKEHYLKCANAYQAAISAGYAASTADKKAYAWVGESRGDCPENMRHVWDGIREAIGERSERNKIDSDYVLQRHVEIDKMDVLDIISDDGCFRAISEWPRVWRQFLSGFDVAEIYEGRGDDKQVAGVLKKIKWPDKLRNLELLGKHVSVGAYSDKINHSGTIVDELAGLMQELSNEATSGAD